MQYIIVTQHQIEDLRASMDLFEQLWGEDVDEHALFLYGMVRDEPALITPMEDAVREENDLHKAIKINMATVVIPISSDVLYYLTGSGLILRDENFAYISDKEIRTSSLSWTNQEPRITLASFTKMALAANDYHSEDFLKWEGTEALEHGTPTQERTEVATKPQEPTEPQEGGIQSPEGGAVAKASSAVTTEPQVWSTSNIEDASGEELFALRNKLIEGSSGADILHTNSQFVWFPASHASGFLIQTDEAQEAFAYIAKKLGLDISEVEEESTIMTGRELVEYIESLLGE